MNLFGSIFGKPVPSVSAVEAQNRLKNSPAPFVLDVREPDEYQSGHVNGAKLIPLGKLSERLSEVPKDREILCVCASGSRSSVAARHLQAAGYQVINLSGGMYGWSAAQLPVKRGSGR